MATWPSFLINLADNRVRLENSSEQFERLGLDWQRIDAVLGKDLPEAEVGRVYDAHRNRRYFKTNLVPAEIGCYLSHYNCWKEIAEGEADGGFIFEDDFKALDSLPEVMAALSVDHDDWDMVKLFTFEKDAPVTDSRPLGEHHRLVTPYRVPTCLIGYGLTKAAAKRLTQNALPFFRPVDEDQKFFWETGLRVKLALPAPVAVGDQQTVTGTVGTARRAERLPTLEKLWRSATYRLGYVLRLHYHRFRERGRT